MKQVFYYFVCGLGWLVLGLSAAVVSGCRGGDEVPERHVYVSEIRSLNKLVVGQMTISKMASVDDLKLDEADGMKQTASALISAIKIGDRKAAYSYDTYLQAFIDLSDLDADDVVVDEDEKTITITLPPVQTEFRGRDMGIREEHYRVTGLRSSINPDERARLKEKMNAALKREVEQDATFREALKAKGEQKAAKVIEKLVATDGYSVNVKFKER